MTEAAYKDWMKQMSDRDDIYRDALISIAAQQSWAPGLFGWKTMARWCAQRAQQALNDADSATSK